MNFFFLSTITLVAFSPLSIEWVRSNENEVYHTNKSQQYTISSLPLELPHELSPTRLLKWARHNHVQIKWNTSSTNRLQHIVCHVVRRNSSAIKYDRVSIAFILALFYWLNHYTMKAWRKGACLCSPRSMFPQVYVPPGPCSPRSMFPQVYVPPGPCSPRSMFPQVYVPPGLCSPRSMFPQVHVPPGLCSPRSMFPQVYVPPGPCSLRSMFLQVYVPPGLCSPRSMFPQVYVPPGPCSPRSMFPQMYVPPGQTCYVICHIFYVMPYIICHVICHVMYHVTCHALCHVVSRPEREDIEGSHAGHGECGGCFYHWLLLKPADGSLAPRFGMVYTSDTSFLLCPGPH